MRKRIAWGIMYGVVSALLALVVVVCWEVPGMAVYVAVLLAFGWACFVLATPAETYVRPRNPTAPARPLQCSERERAERAGYACERAERIACAFPHCNCGPSKP